MIVGPSVFALFFCGLFLLYAFTAYPSVPGGDSGELMATACTLGVAHPPGYPTISIVGWLYLQLLQFSGVIPKFSKPALALNVLAGFLSAAATTLMAMTVHNMHHSSFFSECACHRFRH